MSDDKTRIKNYATLTLDLGTVRADTKIDLPGIYDHLTVIALSPSATVSIKINDVNSDSLDLTLVTTVETPMRCLYVTNAAQSGLSLVLGLGADAKFNIATTYRNQRLRVWKVVTATQATTNAYATLHTGNLGILASGGSGNQKCTILLTETAGQNVMYKVDVSMDLTVWVTLKTDVDLLANASAYETLSDPWIYLRTQIIDKVAGVHGSVSETRYGYTIT